MYFCKKSKIIGKSAQVKYNSIKNYENPILLRPTPRVFRQP